METTAEQKEMQEKINNMSPEELRKFQKEQCIFCQMNNGKIQARKIYEDDKVFAILDINPANPGHILLLPKEHYMIMPQMPDNELEYIFTVAKNLSNTLLRSLGVEGTNIFVANGAAAGQRAQHFMIHIIPRMEGDNVGFELARNDIDDARMEEIRKTLSASISKSTGIGLPESEDEIEETPEEVEVDKQEEQEEKTEEEKPQEEKEEQAEEDEVEEQAEEKVKEEEKVEKTVDEEKTEEDKPQEEKEEQTEEEVKEEEIVEEQEKTDDPETQESEEKVEQRIDKILEEKRPEQEDDDDFEEKKADLDRIAELLGGK